MKLYLAKGVIWWPFGHLLGSISLSALGVGVRQQAIKMRA